MGHNCSTCRYFDLESDALPCADCRFCGGGNMNDCWAPCIEDITDPFERLGAILEQNTYILLEIGRLRNELNKLKEKYHE